MVFGWADDIQVAESAIVLHCSFRQKEQAYYVLPTWENQDITAALVVVRSIFHVLDGIPLPLEDHMSVKLSRKALVYLKRIGNTDDASLLLKGSDVRAANELKKLDFVTYIARSQGGADVALTRTGLDYYDALDDQ